MGGRRVGGVAGSVNTHTSRINPKPLTETLRRYLELEGQSD